MITINSKIINNNIDKVKTLENLITEIKCHGFKKITNEIKEKTKKKLDLEKNVNEMDNRSRSMKEEISV